MDILSCHYSSFSIHHDIGLNSGPSLLLWASDCHMHWNTLKVFESTSRLQNFVASVEFIACEWCLFDEYIADTSTLSQLLWMKSKII